MKNYKACISKFLVFLILLGFLGGFSSPRSLGAVMVNVNPPCKSAILMEGISGKVLFEKDADLKLPPASITKVMSLLLVMEAMEDGRFNLNDKVTASAHAVSMGGSQIWLKENEQMTVEELLKAAAISSANDATVALAELVAGSEEGFVKLMNEKAEELNMKNTVFQNATGLDAENHYSTARDIAIMGNALLAHEEIKDYSTVWMDELRQGKTQLVNTNKLIRFYKGATGLKTGTTDGAGSCLCATATRNNLPLIAVTMGSDTSDNRFNSARGLLDYGFSNFEAAEVPMPPPLEPLKVTGGLNRHVGVKDSAPPFMLLEKGTPKEFKTIVKAEETLTAPVAENQKIGRVKILQEGVVITEYDLLTSYPVEKITFKKALKPVIFAIFCM